MRGRQARQMRTRTLLREAAHVQPGYKACPAVPLFLECPQLPEQMFLHLPQHTEGGTPGLEETLDSCF